MKRLRTRHRSSSSSQTRRGFTLLEMILALGLSSLLLAGVYAALQMHWSAASLGQVEMERSQVARALFRRIETDLRSVVFRDTPLSSTTDDGSSSSSSSTSSSNSTSGTSSTSSGSSSSNTSSSGTTSDSSSTTTTDAYSTQKSGLFGDSQSLVVHLSLPSRASNLAASVQSTNNAATLSGSDLQSVLYFLAGSGSTMAQQLSGPLNSPTTQATGLARLQGDRMAMQAAEESGGLSSMAAGVQLLAPEVAAIQFEYFDGISWGSSWDSATTNSLPNAIRITIEFHPPTATKGWYSRPVSASTDRFQHTVALPLAQPYVSSDSL